MVSFAHHARNVRSSVAYIGICRTCAAGLCHNRRKRRSLSDVGRMCCDVAHTSAEVIFGESVKDIQSEDFKTKMREVRSSSTKGMDPFAIMAKYITPAASCYHFGPWDQRRNERNRVSQDHPACRRCLLNIVSGLDADKHLTPAELLALCHTVMSQNLRLLKDALSSKERKGI